MRIVHFEKGGARGIAADEGSDKAQICCVSAEASDNRRQST